MSMAQHFIFLITKTSSKQFGAYHLRKMFLYFDILTWSPILNLRSLSILSLHLTLTGFLLIVSWNILLYVFMSYIV